MNDHEPTKKQRAVFLFIALYVLGFAGFLALQFFPVAIPDFYGLIIF